MSYAIEMKDLQKSFIYKKYKKREIIQAVNGVSLTVNAGEIFGFLGPNGAGKTTTLRMLTTLLPIDAGEASVAGYDLVKQPGEVRRHIGYVGQMGGSDLQATGRENLMLSGQLYGMSKSEAADRAEELSTFLDIGEIKNRIVRTYSGGQRRRLEVALGLMHRPAVLFLDEPTVGLDPQNRANLWAQIRKLRDGGTTVFLTTHYLDEANHLADRIAIMDYGKIVAMGTPDELKRQIEGHENPTLDDVFLETTGRNLRDITAGGRG